MTLTGWLQLAVFFLLVLLVTKPLGAYMARVFEGERRGFHRCSFRSSASSTGSAASNREQEMTWYAYMFAMLAFSAVGLVWLYAAAAHAAVAAVQSAAFPNMAPDLAWNTAVSFLTNTNWQFYSGESAMSYLSQMAGLAWHNFVSAAAGIAIAVAVVRGIARTGGKTLGNFWVDLTRRCLYVLLPIVDRRLTGSRHAGRAAEFSRVPDGEDDRGLLADDHRRPDGLAGSHQGTRHERRRFRQRQLRIAEREPDAVLQLLRNAC